MIQKYLIFTIILCLMKCCLKKEQKFSGWDQNNCILYKFIACLFLTCSTGFIKLQRKAKTHANHKEDKFDHQISVIRTQNGVWCCWWDCPMFRWHDALLEDESADGIEASSSTPTWGSTAARGLIVIRTIGSKWACRSRLESPGSGIELLLLEGKEQILF